MDETFSLDDFSGTGPRREVIERLVAAATAALRSSAAGDCSPAEMLSASVTLTRALMITIMEASTDANREYNRDVMLTMLDMLYQDLDPTPAADLAELVDKMFQHGDFKTKH